MRRQVLWFWVFQLLCINTVYGDTDYQQVQIADPYIELHTGPGSGYPIFHVIERGETVKVFVRRTDWFKISDNAGHVGWANIEQLSLTLTPAGEKVEFTNITREEFEQRHWETGVLGGDFGGATIMSFYGAYLFNSNFSTEFGYSQAIGSASSSDIWHVDMLMQPFPDWKYSPFVHMGTGIIDINPKATLIKPKDLTSQFTKFGFGVRSYLTKRIVMRLEYNDYVIFSATKDTDENEDIKEWKAGFAVFF